MPGARTARRTSGRRAVSDVPESTVFSNSRGASEMSGRVSFFFELYPNAFKAQETESGSAWATNKKRAD
jgi:hypothetical protein